MVKVAKTKESSENGQLSEQKSSHYQSIASLKWPFWLIHAKQIVVARAEVVTRSVQVG